MSEDSVYTEAVGLLQAIQTHARDLAGKVIRHRTDNLSTYYIVRNGGSKSARLNLIARKLWMMTTRLRCSLQSEYVGSAGIIASGADTLSREFDNDFALRPTVFAQLYASHGPFLVDRFASERSVQHHPASGLPLAYYSALLSADCIGVDGLSTSWEAGDYAFPPLALAFPAVEAFLKASGKCCIILPDWPAQPWWPLLEGNPRILKVPLGHCDDILCPVLPSTTLKVVDQTATQASLSFSAYILSRDELGTDLDPVAGYAHGSGEFSC